MPRTWFSWTDSVLLGSNKLFIVSEMTVPGLRHAKQLVGGDQRAAGRRAEAAGHRQPLRAAHVRIRACASPTSSRRSGEAFAGCVPNHYRLVREAIDRGVPLDEVKPGNKITLQLKKLMLPQAAGKAPSADAQGLMKKFKLSLAR